MRRAAPLHAAAVLAALLPLLLAALLPSASAPRFARAALAANDSAYLDAVLGLNYAQLNATFKATRAALAVAPTSCAFYRACPANGATDWGVYNTTYAVDALFGSAPIDRDFMVHRQFPGATVSADDTRRACATDTLRAQWLDNLVGTSLSVRWQYVGWNTGYYDIYPGTNWTALSGCPGTYDPRVRPWYTAAASSPKDFVIVIGTANRTANSAAALGASLAAARALLSSLSYFDYVGAISFAETPSLFSQTMLRATDNVTATLLAWINNITLSVGAPGLSNLGLAMQSAQTLLDTSALLNGTASCRRMIAVMFDGYNDIATISPTTAVSTSATSSGEGVLLFPVLTGPVTYQVVANALACAGRGVISSLTTSSSTSARAVVDRIYSYLAASSVSTAVRCSQPYVDAFGLGLVTTCGMAVYNGTGETYGDFLGVAAVDLLMSNLTRNGSISEDDLISYLFNTQVCESFSANAAVALALNGNVDVCASNGGGGSSFTRPQWVDLFGLWVALSLLVVIVFTLAPFLVVVRKRDLLCLLSLVITPILGIIAIGVLWGLLWGNLVVFYTWAKTEMTVTRNDINPYRCCELTSCSYCTNYFGESCSYKLATLQAGSCNAGYHCCYSHCYRCNCVTHCSRMAPEAQAALGGDSGVVDARHWRPLGAAGNQTAALIAAAAADRARYSRGGGGLGDALLADDDAAGFDEAAWEQARAADVAASARAAASFGEHLDGSLAWRDTDSTEFGGDEVDEVDADADGAPPAEYVRDARGEVRRCSTRCSTCCYCAQSVSARQCTVTCGTCSTPTVSVSYSNQYTALTVRSAVSKSCGRDDTACYTAFFALYGDVGGKFIGYFDPDNDTNWTNSRDISLAGIVVTALFGGLCLLSFIVFCCLRCRTRSSVRNSKW